MNNGKYHDPIKLEILMAENNKLLREQLNHLIALRADLQTVMVYLPACASGREASREAVLRLAKASAHCVTDLTRESRQRLKRRRRR
jgi:hypothetical protein